MERSHAVTKRAKLALDIYCQNCNCTPGDLLKKGRNYLTQVQSFLYWANQVRRVPIKELTTVVGRSAKTVSKYVAEYSEYLREGHGVNYDANMTKILRQREPLSVVIARSNVTKVPKFVSAASCTTESLETALNAAFAAFLIKQSRKWENA